MIKTVLVEDHTTEKEALCVWVNLEQSRNVLIQLWQRPIFCLHCWSTKRFPNEGWKTFWTEGLIQEKEFDLHDNFFQSFPTEKSSFEFEFISWIKTGLESAEMCNCSCINITIRWGNQICSSKGLIEIVVYSTSVDVQKKS